MRTETPSRPISRALSDEVIRGELFHSLPGSNADSEELLQEIACRGLKAESTGRYREELACPLAFLGGIGRMVLRERGRRARRSPVSAGGREELEASSLSHSDPLAELIRAEAWEAVRNVLERAASSEDRTLLLVHYGCVDAGSIGSPLNSRQRARLFRLIRRLRRELTGHV